MVEHVPLIQTILVVIALLVNTTRPKEPEWLLIILPLILISGIVYLVFTRDRRHVEILAEIGLLLICLMYLALVSIVVFL